MKERLTTSEVRFIKNAKYENEEWVNYMLSLHGWVLFIDQVQIFKHEAFHFKRYRNPKMILQGLTPIEAFRRPIDLKEWHKNRSYHDFKYQNF